VASVDADAAPTKPEWTAVSSVRLLRDLCEHSKRGDHAWVEARVQLPLQGIQSMNASDRDQMLAVHENSSVEEFHYTRYCLMLSDTDSALRDFTLNEKNASGLIDLGPVAHRVHFDLSVTPPRLTTIDAVIDPSVIPPPPATPRPYMLEAPPAGFTRDESARAPTLRREVIRQLRAKSACIDAYTTKYESVFRVRAIATNHGGIDVMPFQLVRASLLSCLRSQFREFKSKQPGGTSAIIEVRIPLSAGE
jgi:hypothetical protein